MEIYTPEVLIRHWGKEILAVRTDIHMGKVLERKAGTMGGYQCHVKEESHYLLKGSMRLRTTDGDRVVHAPIAWTVPPLTVHQEEALTDCLLFEVSDPTREDRYALEPDPGGLPSMSNGAACAKLQDLADAYRRKAVDCDHLITAIRTFGLKGVAT
jgi:mannose-6-phosphate isomerase-like protein (cupin superfamily)